MKDNPEAGVKETRDGLTITKTGQWTNILRNQKLGNQKYQRLTFVNTVFISLKLSDAQQCLIYNL